MRVLSLFDGMACGMLAMQKAGVEVEEYHAFEIDGQAIKTALHNFPQIIELGNVFDADFRQFDGVDFLIGGSPCTYWSIAKASGTRETTASGEGWELFKQYLRAIDEAKPHWFIYENNKSMSDDIRESITEQFGFEPHEINSALVSAQNRERLYWVGQRAEDGTYYRVRVEQPTDKGILLRDILDGSEPIGVTGGGKSFVMRCSYEYGQSLGRTMDKGVSTLCAEEVSMDSNYVKRVGEWPKPDGTLGNSKQTRIYGTNGKAVTICGNGGGMGAKTGIYALQVGEPMKVHEAVASGYAVIPEGGVCRYATPNKPNEEGQKDGV